MNIITKLPSHHRFWLPRTAILLVLIALLVPSFLLNAATTTTTFSNNGSITVAAAGGAPGETYIGPSNPYPSNITVSGLNGVVTGVTVTLYNVTHPRPDDFDIVLVGPNSGGGQSAVVLMSDAGDNVAIPDPITGVAVDLTFQDGAGGLPDSTALSSGTYSPSNYPSANDNDEGISGLPGSPAGTSLSVFNLANPNTTWSLYVYDDRNTNGKDSGVLGGWSITLTVDDSDNPVLPTSLPPPTPTPLPLLGSYDGVILDDVILSDVPQEVRYGIFARLLVRNGNYLPNVHGGHIGNQGLIDRGIIHAVDISTVPGVSLGGGVSLCFVGTGDLYFLNAEGTPRIAQLLDSIVVGESTCGTIYSPGTLVLTRSQNQTTTTSALADCEVRTIYRMNLRAEPALESDVLTVLDPNVSLPASELVNGWYHVSYQEYDGWVAAEFVNTSGVCA